MIGAKRECAKGRVEQVVVVVTSGVCVCRRGNWGVGGGLDWRLKCASILLQQRSPKFCTIVPVPPYLAGSMYIAKTAAAVGIRLRNSVVCGNRFLNVGLPIYNMVCFIKRCEKQQHVRATVLLCTPLD